MKLLKTGRDPELHRRGFVLSTPRQTWPLVTATPNCDGHWNQSLGLTDVTFIHAQNQARREQAGPSRTAALERIWQIAAPTASVAEHRSSWVSPTRQ